MGELFETPNVTASDHCRCISESGCANEASSEHLNNESHMLCPLRTAAKECLERGLAYGTAG